MPDALLNLNMGQVQAVIDGYSERILDATCNAVWTGYYAAYFFSKHPKKPTEIIKQILREGSADKVQKQIELDMDAELELYAQRDLRRFEIDRG